MLAEGGRAIFSPPEATAFTAPPAPAQAWPRNTDCGSTRWRPASATRRRTSARASTLRSCCRSAAPTPTTAAAAAGRRPPHAAGGYLELVKFLLEAKADVNAANRHGAPPPPPPPPPHTRTPPRPPPLPPLTGVHPLHIAVKREYDDCIEYLMNCELPVAKVKEELGWAVQYDLSESVFCPLRNGAPHGLRVLCPWTCHSRHPIARTIRALGYYVVCRGWKVAEMEEVLTRVDAAAGRHRRRRRRPRAAAAEAVADTELAETSKPYQASSSTWPRLRPAPPTC